MAEILVIHRENYISTKLYEYLREEGHRVACSESHEETLSIIDELSLDLVMIDAGMDNNNGRDIFQELQSRISTLEAILICKKPDIRTVIDSIQGGIRDYIETPVDRDILLRTVTRILRQKKMKDLNRRLMDENLLYQNHLEQMVASKHHSLNETLLQLIETQDREKTGLAHTLFDCCTRQIGTLQDHWQKLRNTPEALPADLDRDACSALLDEAHSRSRALLYWLNPLELGQSGIGHALQLALPAILPENPDTVSINLNKTESLLEGGWDVQLYRALEELLLVLGQDKQPLTIEDSGSSDSRIEIRIRGCACPEASFTTEPALMIARERIVTLEGSLLPAEDDGVLLQIPLRKTGSTP